MRFEKAGLDQALVRKLTAQRADQAPWPVKGGRGHRPGREGQGDEPLRHVRRAGGLRIPALHDGHERHARAAQHPCFEEKMQKISEVLLSR